ncbi:hypothetical protein ACVIEO_002851 [Rhizobium leguminosarum]
MRVQTTIEIFDYWNRIRGAADAPLKSQVEPSAVPHLLQSLFILERREGGDIGFRLAGTRICDLFGRDLRGERFSSLWANSQLADIERTAMGVMDHAMPALFNATGYSTVGHQASFEIIMMPLRSPDGACDRLLGAIAPAVRVGRITSCAAYCLQPQIRLRAEIVSAISRSAGISAFSTVSQAAISTTGNILMPLSAPLWTRVL